MAQMDYRKAFYSKYVSTHTSHRYGDSASTPGDGNYPLWRRSYRRFLPSRRDAALLDCGCGDGSFLAWLRAEGFTGLTGIDLSGEQVEKARALGVAEVFEDDVFQFLQGKERTFDVIFARDLIEHLTKEEALRFLSLAHLALVPGGGLVVQTVNGESPLFGRLAYGDFTHQTIFTRASLRQAMRIAGFEGSIDGFAQEPAVHGLRSAARFVLWRAIDAMVRVYLLADTGRADGVFSQNVIVVARR